MDLGGSDVKIDSASDQDILGEALAGEKPPSKIIPSSGSDPEVMVDVPTLPTDPNLTRGVQTTGTLCRIPDGRGEQGPKRHKETDPDAIEDDDDASFRHRRRPGKRGKLLDFEFAGIRSAADQSDASTGRVHLLAHLRPKGGSGVISRKDLPRRRRPRPAAMPLSSAMNSSTTINHRPSISAAGHQSTCRSRSALIAASARPSLRPIRALGRAVRRSARTARPSI